MKRGWRWFKRLMIGLVAVIVVAVAFVLIALHTDWGRNIVRHQVEGILADSFPGGATIGRIDGSPFGTLVITDIVLSGPDKQPLVTVARVEVEASLSPLLAHEVWVDRIVASGVTITNPRAPKPPDDKLKEPSPWTIVLPNVEVHGAAVHIDGAEPIDIAGLDAFAGLHIAPITGELSAIAMLGATWTQRTAPLGGLVSVVVGDDIAVPMLALSAAGANVVVAGGRVNAPAGRVFVSAPATTIAKLAGVALPADVWFTIDAGTVGVISKATLSGAMGPSKLRGRVVGNVAALTVNAVIAATDVDLALVTKGAAIGHGAALVGVVANPAGARGTVIAATGTVVAPKVHRRRKKKPVPDDDAPLSVPSVNAVIGFDAAKDRATGIVLANAAGRARAAIVGGAHLKGDAVVVDDVRVGATVPELWVASGGLAPVKGSLDLEAKANGEVGTALEVEGWFVGKRIRVEQLAIADARGNFAATIGTALALSGTVTALGISNAGKPMGKATVVARTRDDGRIAVDVDAVPAMAPVIANVSAIVALPTADGVIDIELETHRFQLPHGVWAGKGGKVRIDKRAIAVTDIRSASGDARLAVNVNAGRGTGVITGKIKVTDANASQVSKDFGGSVDVDLAIEKRGIKWKGGGTISVHGLALAKQALPVDANLDLAVDGRRVKVGVRASSPSVGGGHVAIEVDGPRDLTDVDAWKHVARTDLHGITVGLDSLNGRAVSGDKVPGIFDGSIEIREGVPDGKLRVRGIPTPVGTAGADLTVALDDVGFLDIKGEGSVGNAGDATIGARIQIPDHPFDVEVYKRVGKNLVQSASVTTSPIEINPDVLAKLGVISPYSGIVVAKIDVGVGGSSIGVGVDVTGVTGGPLRAPLEVHVGARVDEKETTAQLSVTARQGVLVELKNARTPVSLDQWTLLAAQKPFALPNAPIEGTLSIPTLDAKTTLALVGRRDVVGGTLAGAITAGGTLTAPTATGTIDLANIAVRPRLTGKPPPVLTALHVAASWEAAKASLRITGEEAGEKASDKGTLLVDASGDPKKLGELAGLVKVTNFDLAPIAVFLPGMLVGAQGKLETDVKLMGLDPTAGNVRGFVSLTKLRLPFSPLFSPLRDGKLRIDLDDAGMHAKLDGVVGGKGSTVSLTANADPRGIDTTIDGKVVELTPIGFLQPKISANIQGTLHREKLFWSGDLTVWRGLVFIPETRGNDLLDDAVPADLVFVGEDEVDAESLRLRPPTKPFLVVDVTIKPVRIEMPSFVIPTLIDVPIIERGKATAAGKVRLSVGDTIGMDGEILVDRGSVTVFGRTYDVELGQVGFDGTIDPLFDVKLAHEYETQGVTTYVRFAGRLSEIDTLEPEFTSDPGTYAQGELFGFFLGGTPGADSSKQGQEAITGAGAALGFSVITAQLKKFRYNPDVFRCDPATSSTGTSCLFGKYFGKRDQVFIGYRYRLAPRLDENQNEGRLEYTFRRNLSLELSGGDGGIFGLDVLRRRRF